MLDGLAILLSIREAIGQNCVAMKVSELRARSRLTVGHWKSALVNYTGMQY